jgi:hypothetical protein
MLVCSLCILNQNYGIPRAADCRRKRAEVNESTREANMADKLYFSPPVFTLSDGIQFSAYHVDWGYQSYTLPVDTVRSQLGARDASREQVLLAFGLNQPRIARAIEHLPASEDGHPTLIRASDLQ